MGFGRGCAVCLVTLSLAASASCTEERQPPDLPEGRRDCPTGLVRANSETFEGAFERMEGHIPTVLPDAFGVASAWGEGEGKLGQVLFVDASCREIFVGFSDRQLRLSHGSSFGRWAVTSSGPRDCGNGVLGDARCLRYSANLDDGTVSVLMMGLERSEGDPVVQSIPLDD